MPVIRLSGANDEFPVMHYAKSLNNLFSVKYGLPPRVKLVAPLATDISYVFRNSNGAVEVDVTAGDLSGGNTDFAFYSTSIQKVWLRSSIAGCLSMRYMFGNANVTGIYGEPLDISAATDVFHMFGSALQDVEFVPSCIKLDVAFPSDDLTTASLLQIANGLDAAVTGKTLTVTAAVKAIMDTLMVDNAGDTAAAGSTMSLTDFITTIKGWSVATL